MNRARSVVTHRAVPRHLTLQVARDAKAHVVDVVHPLDLGHALHVAVAGGASVGAEGLDMALMGEVGKASEVVHPHPFDGLLLRPGVAELLDLDLVAAVATGDDGVAAY